MAGEMIMVGFRGQSLPDNAPILQALITGGVGGVILFSKDQLTGGPRNVISPSQVKALTEQLRRAGLLVAVNQEGGKVQRLFSRNGFRDWPSARTLGRDRPEATYASAVNMGGVLAEAGFNLNFAPSVDLHRPDCPAIGDLERAFAAQPTQTTAHARAFIRGMEDAGVLCALKHFPGHGSARGDTHNGVADVSDTWSERELEPYRVLIDEGFDGMIMAAHVSLRRYGDLPASLSPSVINGLLRGELGWNGVVVTDDL